MSAPACTTRVGFAPASKSAALLRVLQIHSLERELATFIYLCLFRPPKSVLVGLSLFLSLSLSSLSVSLVSLERDSAISDQASETLYTDVDSDDDGVSMSTGPGCNSNLFVCMLTPSSHQMKGCNVGDSSKLRAFHSTRVSICPFGGKYGCYNPRCPHVLDRFTWAGRRHAAGAPRLDKRSRATTR